MLQNSFKEDRCFKILYWSSDSEDISWGKRLLHVWSLLARLLDSGSRAWLGWCWWCDMTQLNMEQLTLSEWLREQQVVVISSIKFEIFSYGGNQQYFEKIENTFTIVLQIV